jgi:hypothetical protein
VLKSFANLLYEYEQSKLRLTTKEELASKAKNKELVKMASGYTPDQILKGLTELQLNFAETIGKWTQTLQNEAKKQNELQLAIEVEDERLKTLQNVKVAADALYLLKQEHQSKNEALDKKYVELNTVLDETILKEREKWTKEQQEFDLAVAEFEAKLKKERSKENEEYQYSVERLRKHEQDEYEEKKRITERELNEENAQKTLNWQEREAILAKEKADYEANLKKIEEFPAKLEEELKKEREEAAKEASREAKTKADLLEKEESANKLIAEQKIASLEKSIESNQSELEKLTLQLNEALAKVQDLSLRALENNKAPKA